MVQPPEGNTSCYRRHAEENDDQHDRDKVKLLFFHLQVCLL